MGKLSRHLGIVLLGLLVMAGLVFLPARTVKADGELENGWCRFDPESQTLYLKRGNTEMQRERYNLDQTYTNIKLPGDITPEDVYHVKTEGESGTVDFPADCSMLFYKFDYCSDFDFSNSNTSSVTNMASMFGRCDYATTIDVSSFDTSKVKNMNSLFGSCGDLKSVTFGPNFKTDSVTDMSSMFINCFDLESLDLSSFEVTSNTDVSSMFYDCRSLENIYVASDWPAPTKCTDVFFNNFKLKGGAGTAYNVANRSNNAYLKIDRGESAPGYFTLKGTTPYMVPYMRVEARDNDFAMYFYLSLGRVYNPDSEQANQDYIELTSYSVNYNNGQLYKYDAGLTGDPVNYLRLSDDHRYLYFRVNRKPNDIAVIDNFKITYTPAYEDMVTLYDQDVSLEQYLKTVYNNSDYAALKPVVGNMIRYCSAAQHYYDNVSLDQVACKGLTGYELSDLDSIDFPDASDYSSGTNIMSFYEYDGISYFGSTTTFDKKISLILAFRLDEESDNHADRIAEFINAHKGESVTVNCDYDESKKYYLAEFTAPIKKLDTVAFKFGDTEMSIVKYLSKSAASNSADEAYVYLAKALYQYHLAAKDN